MRTNVLPRKVPSANQGAVPILPEKPKVKERRTSVSMAEEVWEKLEKIAEESGYTRDEVLEFFSRAGIAQHEADKAEKRKK